MLFQITIGVFFFFFFFFLTMKRLMMQLKELVSLKQLASLRIGHMFHLIKDFLSNRYLKVRVGSKFSDPFIQEEGVPQNSVLIVTLYDAAINRILENVATGVQGSLFFFFLFYDFVMYCNGSQHHRGMS